MCYTTEQIEAIKKFEAEQDALINEEKSERRD